MKKILAAMMLTVAPLAAEAGSYCDNSAELAKYILDQRIAGTADKDLLIGFVKANKNFSVREGIFLQSMIEIGFSETIPIDTAPREVSMLVYTEATRDFCTRMDFDR